MVKVRKRHEHGTRLRLVIIFKETLFNQLL